MHTFAEPTLKGRPEMFGAFWDKVYDSNCPTACTLAMLFKL